MRKMEKVDKDMELETEVSNLDQSISNKIANRKF